MLLQKGAIMGDSVLAHEIVPWWSPDATVAAQASASQQILQEKGLDPELVRRLTQIGGPTLADTDPTRIMPVAVGALNMANVEIGNWTRQRRRAKEHALGLGSAPKSNEGSAEPGPEPEPEPLRSRVLSTVLRAGAVISIPIATQVPAVLLVYWATSACATFAQNMYFARKEAE
ncbi:hypothetical protein MVES_003536 [Malassezia vespertilionis]|uniref:Uncharacterized protein n=2 Tax=Malassezia vespertilionis TaxID=2020962 RepID=A0A2N1J808_9BASI|nr:hypothetical protein MVES_003536 [Malassezia vespertilionis]